ncbi:unnamed protein product [Eruca vesicaria subsp. sativa]|uniref:Uncharacterized protein n=1 Tax=Eruca vesicaria subsp. sativa TaxID=29727 RepID=A0ABC8J1R8_ERUVS|nr:unnamed protein product [Eruca vesicaria subsp. sativa]
MRKASETLTSTSSFVKSEEKSEKKPPFRLAVDDTKPVLQDPILRSDPMETEEAVLRLPSFPVMRPSKS